MRILNPHITPERWSDPQYGAVLYVFSRLGWSDKRHVCFSHVHQDGIDKEGLLAESRAWSHGEQVLVKIALDLFDPGCVASAGHTPAGWGEVAYLLDRENMAIVLIALRIARQELRIAEIGELENGHLEVSIILGSLGNG